MAAVRHGVDHPGMSERGLHRIEDDLAETWLEDWAGAGVAEIEDFLSKHAAFLSFLEGTRRARASRRHAARPLMVGVAADALSFRAPHLFR